MNKLAIVCPNLVYEWNAERNSPVKFTDLTEGSNKKYWWKCASYHEWQSSAGNRKRGSGCPACRGLMVISGMNDLATTNPKLAKEWHPMRNLKTPSEVTQSSNKKAWWICDKDSRHEWEASINNRSNGNGCPVCKNQVIIPGVNDLATLNTDLEKQWDYSKNSHLDPTKVGIGSGKSAWWICPLDSTHTWKARIVNRTQGKGCPVCLNQIVIAGKNDFATMRPDLAAEWHPSNAEGPEKFPPRSGRKVYWQCQNFTNHVWKTSIASRVNGSGCSICAGKVILSGYNDLQAVNPLLASQWHPFKNKKLTPSQVAAGSSKKAWWICDKLHEWEAIISSRNRGHGCRQCSEPGTSKIQQAFHQSLAKIFPDLECDVHILIPFKKKLSMNVDMFSADLKLVVEYDGHYYHSGALSGRSTTSHMAHDTEKTQMLVNAGYRVIRIRENGLPHLGMKTQNVFELDYKYGTSMDNPIAMMKEWLEETSQLNLGTTSP